tara:strand:- start:411 stop:587 length:177 start_codon:yes stop_codon:yes gene_type:complete
VDTNLLDLLKVKERNMKGKYILQSMEQLNVGYATQRTQHTQSLIGFVVRANQEIIFVM